jgi:hypothetical protein
MIRTDSTKRPDAELVTATVVVGIARGIGGGERE